jgi:integrase
MYRIDKNEIEIEFTDMGDALMNWDGTQSRWRKDYKGKTYRIKASDLGGTNYTDTKLAANHWFQGKRVERDRELALEVPRPNELEYRLVLENIRTEMKALLSILRGNPALQPVLLPVIEIQKQRITLLEQVLRQDVLPALDDALRNPLHISPERIDGESFNEARQQIAEQIRGQGTIRVSREEWQDMEGYIPYNHPQLGIDDSVYLDEDHDDNTQFYKRMSLMTKHNSSLADRVLEERIQTEAGRVAGLKDELLAGKKQELGLIESEFERGIMTQLVKEHGVTVVENLTLNYHIDKFLEYYQRRYAEKKIGAGSLEKIIGTIKPYREWSPIINGRVDRIAAKEHIDAYYKHVSDRKIAGEIGAEYGNQLLWTLKTLIGWLVDEEILQVYPACLQRKGRYMFRVERQKPEVIPLPLVHRILDVATANPRLKLCILLTLNCGFGAAEIGQIRKDEYNPKTGRITRRRSKTRRSANAPTVCYKLWDITKGLLDQEIAKCKERQDYKSTDCLLVNSRGKPLWYEYVANGKPSKNNTIASNYQRFLSELRANNPDIPAIKYYQFRKTSASLIKNEPRYRMLNELWLAHAPRSMADKHYNADDDTILDECIAWLHDKIFGGQASLAEGEKTLK